TNAVHTFGDPDQRPPLRDQGPYPRPCPRSYRRSMKSLARIFFTHRAVIDGRVDCPIHGAVSTEQCARCPWLQSLRHGDTGPAEVTCRVRASSLADLPPS